MTATDILPRIERTIPGVKVKRISPLGDQWLLVLWLPNNIPSEAYNVFRLDGTTLEGKLYLTCGTQLSADAEFDTVLRDYKTATEAQPTAVP